MILEVPLLLLAVIASIQAPYPNVGKVTVSYDSHENGGWSGLYEDFPFPTNGPIDINTHKAEHVVTTPNNEFLMKKKHRKMTNTGNTVIVEADPNSGSYTTGGVLGSAKYNLKESYFVWSSDLDCPSGGSIDGEGTPLHAYKTFVNEKYEFEEAKHHRNGMAILVAPIQVKEIANNTDFDEFGTYLSQITEAGSHVEVPGEVIFKWMYPTKYYPEYYAYPGVYIDFEDNNKKFECATVITNPIKPGPVISVSQFNLFRELRNKDDMKYENHLEPAPTNGRPVVRANNKYLVILEDMQMPTIMKM